MKEVLEETGIECEPRRAHRGARRPAPRLRARADVLARVPLPHDRRRAAAAIRSRRRAVGFFARDALPQPLAGAHRWLDLAFRAIDGEELPDLVRRAPQPHLARRVRRCGAQVVELRRAAARRSRRCRCARSHASPIASWSTRPTRSGGRPSCVGRERRELRAARCSSPYAA